MSETLAKLSMQEFADRLASKAPSPGGGAVAAVTAAHAAALGCMVLAYTLGKPKFAAHENENQVALQSLQRAQIKALALADEDISGKAQAASRWCMAHRHSSLAQRMTNMLTGLHGQYRVRG